MPKRRITLNIDILRPQSEPQKILIQAIKWTLSAGRYLIIFVEIIVLAAFVTRFKFDADIASNKEAIDAQVPYLESLKQNESIIRQVQLQLASIKDIKSKKPGYINLINAISAETPSGITLNNLTLTSEEGRINIKLTGVATNNENLSVFIFGLKNNNNFSEVNLANIGLDRGQINFAITCMSNFGGTSL